MSCAMADLGHATAAVERELHQGKVDVAKLYARSTARSGKVANPVVGCLRSASPRPPAAAARRRSIERAGCGLSQNGVFCVLAMTTPLTSAERFALGQKRRKQLPRTGHAAGIIRRARQTSQAVADVRKRRVPELDGR